MEKILDRFLRYVSVDTQSSEESETQPSTAKQWNLLKMLRDELQALGVEVTLDEYGYVMASIPSNLDKDVPAVGFIAHVDTAPDASGADVNPQIVPNYDGGEIPLKGVPGLSLEMLHYKGQTLITTDGTTLLGADDKAGVAEIMQAVQYLVEHPEFKHGPVKIGFTPDEEIGRGVVKFDVKRFGADYAYTMDGGEIGELEFENFNAASAKIHIQGCNVHPGYAKGKMRNAILIGMELNALLPVAERPEYTEIRQVVAFINAKYGEGTATLELKDSYYNMREQVEPHYHIVEKAVKAMEMAGVQPKIQPIRGGTDGANLSFKGLPCPNIFAGGLNFHGKMEFVPLESIEKASEVVLNLISLYAC